MPKSTKTPSSKKTQVTKSAVKPRKKTTLTDKRKTAAKVPGAKPASRKKS
jgi:hypothetical protein